VLARFLDGYAVHVQKQLSLTTESLVAGFWSLAIGTRIRTKRLDIGYCPAFTPNFHPSLTVHTLGAWPWTLAMAGDHRLAKLPSIGPEDLEDEAFILYSADGAYIGQ
jgi:hypothetical protein